MAGLMAQPLGEYFRTSPVLVFRKGSPGFGLVTVSESVPAYQAFLGRTLGAGRPSATLEP
jgi:hypothetical protein